MSSVGAPDTWGIRVVPAKKVKIVSISILILSGVGSWVGTSARVHLLSGTTSMYPA